MVADVVAVDLVVASDALPLIRPPLPAVLLASLVSWPLAMTIRLPSVACCVPLPFPSDAVVVTVELEVASAAPSARMRPAVMLCALEVCVVELAAAMVTLPLGNTTLLPMFADTVLSSLASETAAFAPTSAAPAPPVVVALTVGVMSAITPRLPLPKTALLPTNACTLSLTSASATLAPIPATPATVMPSAEVVAEDVALAFTVVLAALMFAPAPILAVTALLSLALATTPLTASRSPPTPITACAEAEPVSDAATLTRLKPDVVVFAAMVASMVLLRSASTTTVPATIAPTDTLAFALPAEDELLSLASTASVPCPAVPAVSLPASLAVTELLMSLIDTAALAATRPPAPA